MIDKREKNSKIPQVIHYCWFGKNPKPELVINCIETWRKYCPDFEIIEWNESNFDISQHPFMKEAYEAKKWAFVSDVARLLIVYQKGGIYLDTDVEIKQSFASKIQLDYFFSFESNVYINSGLGFGAIPGHPFVKAMINCYDGLKFNPDKLIPCPRLNTDGLMTVCQTFKRNGSITQTIDDGIIYSVDDYASFAKHLGTMSWVEGTQCNRSKCKIEKIIQDFLQKPKNMQFAEKVLGRKIFLIYVFIAYDFFDTGLFRLVKRKLTKVLKQNI